MVKLTETQSRLTFIYCAGFFWSGEKSQPDSFSVDVDAGIPFFSGFLPINTFESASIVPVDLVPISAVLSLRYVPEIGAAIIQGVAVNVINH